KAPTTLPSRPAANKPESVGLAALRCSLCPACAPPVAGCRAVRDSTLVAWYPSFTHLAREGRMTVTIGRRELLAALGGAAAAWPLASRAQQGERARRVGVLMSTAADDAEGRARIAAFLGELQKLGWIDGRNVRIDTRWPTSTEEVRTYVAELIALAPDVILATGSLSLSPLLEATRTVPIVFENVGDPVGGSFVESLARPGGNATGFSFTEYGMSGKWLELLKGIAPGLTRVAVLRGSRQGSGSGPAGAIP